MKRLRTTVSVLLRLILRVVIARRPEADAAISSLIERRGLPQSLRSFAMTSTVLILTDY